MNTITKFVLLALVVASAPAYASALTVHIPTIRVSTASIERNTSLSRLRRGTTEEPTQTENNVVTSTAPGEDGADGADADGGGTVITGDESTDVHVVNNGPTTSTSGAGNNNGGAAAGAGGVGGRGARGGSVRSGGTSVSATSYNSINSILHMISLWQ